MDSQNIDNQKQNQTQSITGSSTAFFDENSDFAFICKKTEKLASAMYLITNLFSDNEPMKWTLRKKVSELLSFIITYKDIRQSELSNFRNISKTKIQEIVSLLEVASLAGLVSKMNFSILNDEFSKLIESLNSAEKTDSSNDLISGSFFDQAGERSFLPRPSYNNTTLKDNLTLRDNSIFKSTNRQNIILGLLKKKKELTIKDIAQIIKDVSEKTIQRELISLISAGILIKSGERRWSKYSLNIAK